MQSISKFLLAWVLLLGGCSIEAKRAQLMTPTSRECHQRLVLVMQALIDSRNVHLSKEAFTSSSMVVLHHRSYLPFNVDNPMVGVIGSEKIIILRKEGGTCYLELQDEWGKRVRTLPLPKQCRCKTEGYH